MADSTGVFPPLSASFKPGNKREKEAGANDIRMSSFHGEYCDVKYLKRDRAETERRVNEHTHTCM